MQPAKTIPIVLLIVAQIAVAPARAGGPEEDDRYPEDMTFFLPAGLYWFGTLAVDPKNPDTAYMGTHEGQVYRTKDGGLTWERFILVPEVKRFFQSAGERFYAGRVRSPDMESLVKYPRGTAKRSRDFLKRTTISDENASGLEGLIGSEHTESGAKQMGLTLSPTSKPSQQEMSADPSFTRKKINEATEVAHPTGLGHGTAARSVLGTAQFGLGLGGGAPRLASFAWKKTGKPFGGRMNLQQLLKVRARIYMMVWKIVVSPHDSNVVYACTSYGLFKSIDGGENWMRTFVGINILETIAKHIAVDPKDPKNVLLGTGSGLYVSRDGGDNWRKSPSQAVGAGYLNWIQYDRTDPNYVYIATSNGLVRSRDGGRNWDWIYYTTFPTARDTQAFDIDPENPNVGYLGTRDGLFRSDNIREGGLEDWRRMSGLKFTGLWVERLIAAGPGHIYIQTRQLIGFPHVPFGSNFVWETRDTGETWKILDSQHNPSEIMHIELDPEDPELLWILWSRTLHRLRHRKGRPQLPSDELLEQILSEDPPLSDVIMAAYRHCGVEIGQQLDVRSWANATALMPRIQGWFLNGRSPRSYLANDYRTQFMDVPYYLREYPDVTSGYQWGVMLTWDLSPLVYDLRSTLFGRVVGLNTDVLGALHQATTRDYQELLQIKAKLKTDPPRDRLMLLMYVTRIDELTSMLDRLTGGYVSSWKDHHKSGMEVERGM